MEEIHNSAQLIELIDRIGFLPLLDSGIHGFSAEDIVAADCRYVVAGKAGFISREWWPDFCNYRRNKHHEPEEGSIEDAILLTLAEQGSLITRELRALCGFTGPKMRSKFDGYVTRLQMATRIVTEDFVYPVDRHNNEYGWGWSLLTTPEQLYGRDANLCNRTPEESFARICAHMHTICPYASDTQIQKMLR